MDLLSEPNCFFHWSFLSLWLILGPGHIFFSTGSVFRDKVRFFGTGFRVKVCFFGSGIKCFFHWLRFQIMGVFPSLALGSESERSGIG